VRSYLQELEDQGVIERVPTATAASNVVLVAEGQTGQDYRLCTNFTDLNAITVVKYYPLPEIGSVRDQFSYSSIFSAMDIKSGFLNIPVLPESFQYFGLIT
jgi:hypothetical protein